MNSKSKRIVSRVFRILFMLLGVLAIIDTIGIVDIISWESIIDFVSYVYYLDIVS